MQRCRIWKIFGNCFDAILAFAGGFAEGFLGVICGALQAVGIDISVDQLKQKFMDGLTGILSTVNDKMNSVKDKFNEKMDAIQEKVSNAIEKIKVFSELIYRHQKSNCHILRLMEVSA